MPGFGGLELVRFEFACQAVLEEDAIAEECQSVCEVCA